MADRFEICFTLAGTSGAVKTGLESGTMIAADETGGHAPIPWLRWNRIFAIAGTENARNSG